MKNTPCFYMSYFSTCVTHITEADSRDAISMSTTVVWTWLRDVDPIQSKWWSIPIHAALLEPTEPGFTGKMTQTVLNNDRDTAGNCEFQLMFNKNVFRLHICYYSYLAATLRGITTVTLVHCS